MTDTASPTLVDDFFWWMSLEPGDLLQRKHRQNTPGSPLQCLKKLIKKLHLGRGGGFQPAPVASCFSCDAEGRLSCKEEKLTPEFLKTLLRTVHPYHRCPLVLLDVLGLSYADVCKAMSLPRGNIMSALHYARRTLVPDFRQWDLPVNDLLMECGAIVDGGLEIPDEPTYKRILEEDSRLQPYMRAVRELKEKLANIRARSADPDASEKNGEREVRGQDGA